MVYTIYVIENRLNVKSYVGRTSNPDCRWIAHKGSCKSLISKAIKKLGASNFTFRVLDTATSLTEAKGMERLYIHLLESNIPEFGYNDPTLYSWASIEKKDRKANWRLRWYNGVRNPH